MKKPTTTNSKSWAELRYDAVQALAARTCLDVSVSDDVRVSARQELMRPPPDTDAERAAETAKLEFSELQILLAAYEEIEAARALRGATLADPVSDAGRRLIAATLGDDTVLLP